MKKNSLISVIIPSILVSFMLLWGCKKNETVSSSVNDFLEIKNISKKKY